MLEIVVVIGLAAYRCSRLVGEDSIFEGPRHRFFRRFPPDDFYRRMVKMGGAWQMADEPRRKAAWIGRLVACPWCSSVWFAAAITAATAQFFDVPVPILVWAAACSVAGLCAKLADQ